MSVRKGSLLIGGKVVAVAAAFLFGYLAGCLLQGWAAYHRRQGAEHPGAVVCRAVVDRIAGEKQGRLRVELTLVSGPHRGRSVPGVQEITHLRARGRVRKGDRCLVAVRSRNGEFVARVVSPERDRYLLGLAFAFVALLAVTGGRRGLAVAGSVVWALVLLVGVMLPAVAKGAPAATLCMPLALAIAAPTLVAIGGPNRKSLAAMAGTFCGLVAGGLMAVGLTEAMALTGVEAEFGPYHHLDNVLWFAKPFHDVRFGSLLVAGMLLAGLGAVMDVSMAVASTVAEVRRAAPTAPRAQLLRSGVAAGRDIVGVMIFTLAMVYVGSHLVSFVSLAPTGWAARWTLLANYEEIASELARAAAAAVGMALCVPATALVAAALHAGRKPADERSAGRQGVRLRPLLRPLLVVLGCVVAAGLVDEWTLRKLHRVDERRTCQTAGRVVAFDAPTIELSARSTDPRERTFFRSQIAVVQPYFGPRAGDFLATRLLLGPNPSHNLALRRGAAVHLSIDETGERPDVKCLKPQLRYRWGLVAVLVMATTLVVAGGRVGVRVLVAMVGVGALMLAALIPLLSRGYPPLWLTGAFCGATLVTVFAISGAVDRKALSAIAGCAAGLGVAAGLLLVSSRWLRLSGTESVPARFLAEMGGTRYDYVGLLASSLLVAFLGLAMDTAVTVASGVAQVCSAQPTLGRREAVAAGMNISRDVVGTMVLTLLFAFVGMRVLVLLLPAALDLSTAELVNGEAGACQILDALVGSIALAATGPATALAASFFVTRGKLRSVGAENPSRFLPSITAIALAVAVVAGGASWWQLRRERLSRRLVPPLPGNVDDLIASSTQARQRQRTGEALLALWRALERSPGDPRVHTQLAYTHMACHWIVQARREIEAALQAGADDTVTHYVAGVVYAWTDENEKAERHLRRAVDLDPANAAARAALGRLFPPSP